MALGDDDLDVFLGDANATVRRGTYSAPGWFDTEDVMQQGREGFAVMGRRQSLLVKAGSLGEIPTDVEVRVTYTKRGRTVTETRLVHHVEGEPPDMLFERITLAGGED